MVPKGMLKTLPPEEWLHSKVVLAETGSTISIRNLFVSTLFWNQIILCKFCNLIFCNSKREVEK